MTEGILITIALEILFPVLAGFIFALPEKEDTLPKSVFLAKAYTSGQIVLFALFQPLMVFAILKKMEFSRASRFYLIGSLVLIALMIVLMIIKMRDRIKSVLKSPFRKVSFWGILAFVSIAFMIVMSFFKTYMDGDDAYYVSTATQTASSDTMYLTDPYTGDASLFQYRYLLAPFPMWISMLSRFSGIRAVAMAHTFFPWSMMLLAFSVMYILAYELFDAKARKADIFMFFGSILIMFGDYSIYSPENFLLARSRQGKAALASFVIPFLTVLLFTAVKEFDKKKKLSLPKYLLIMLTGFAGALCSTLGGALCVALTCVFALCIMIRYRKLLTPVLMALCSMPCLAFMVLYILRR